VIAKQRRPLPNDARRIAAISTSRPAGPLNHGGSDFVWSLTLIKFDVAKIDQHFLAGLRRKRP
jgi:hypothetical protein